MQAYCKHKSIGNQHLWLVDLLGQPIRGTFSNWLYASKTLSHDPAQKIHIENAFQVVCLNLLFFFWEMTTDRSDNKPSTLLETCNGHITCKNAHRSHVALFICITCVPINKIQGGSKKKRVFSNVFWPHEFCYNKTLFVHI